LHHDELRPDELHPEARMYLRNWSVLALLTASAALVGCTGGGGSTGGARLSPCTSGTSTGSQSFCLTSCNLGCSTTGCNITEIAQNQSLIFVFSHEIDPLSVNAATISMRSPTGEEPVGQYIVNKQTVQFVPEVRVVGASNFFGFRANDTYRLTINGGPKNVNAVKSTAGATLPDSLGCQLNVSRGVVDQDNQPPVAKLITPSTTTEVDQDTTIVIEFSEIIDAAAFNTGVNPILYSLRKSRVVGNTTQRECNPNSPANTLSGLPRISNDPVRGVTIVSFKPADLLPGTICVEIVITNQLRDLSGTPSQGQVFQFVTKASPSGEKSIAEEFTDDSKLDKDNSSGTWTQGYANPGIVGGSGVDGDFGLDLPGIEDLGSNTFLFRTTPEGLKQIEIPRERRYSYEPRIVTDGKLEFANFVLPKNNTLIFRGNRPPVISVRGKTDIQGTIQVSGTDVLTGWDGVNASGRVGTAGGCFGGNGGNGGNKGDGLGNQAAFNGRVGEDIKLSAGHAYAARAVGTGGKGSVQYPISGLANDIVFQGIGGAVCDQIAAGGGGAGFDVAGGIGKAFYTIGNKLTNLGPDAAGGIAFDNFPFPPSTLSIDHFLVGGSGGGGSGSCPFFGTTKLFKSGAGGAGGGGAIAFRSGNSFSIATTGAIRAKGGTAYRNTASLTNMPEGGGGSGGSILLQIGGTVAQSGLMTVAGGLGGLIQNGPPYDIKVSGGDGAAGYIRLETAGTPSVGLLGTCEPLAAARNVAALTETDAKVGCQSLWYSTRELFAPEFLRYVIKAKVNDQPVSYSDDPLLALPLAKDGEAVEFYVQGADLDVLGKPLPNTISEWMKYVGSSSSNQGRSLNDVSKSNYRFQLIFNKTGGRKVQVDSVTIYYKS